MGIVGKGADVVLVRLKRGGGIFCNKKEHIGKKCQCALNEYWKEWEAGSSRLLMVRFQRKKLS